MQPQLHRDITVEDLPRFWAAASGCGLTERLRQTAHQHTYLPVQLPEIPPTQEEVVNDACYLWLTTVLIPDYAKMILCDDEDVERLIDIRNNIDCLPLSPRELSQIHHGSIQPLVCRWWSSVLPYHSLRLAEHNAIGVLYQGCLPKHKHNAKYCVWIISSLLTGIDDEADPRDTLLMQSILARTLTFLSTLKEPSCQSFRLS